jgi:NitT/TauT family transport system substrate-binding protein
MRRRGWSLAIAPLILALACAAPPATSPSVQPSGARPEGAGAAAPTAAPAVAPAPPTKVVMAHFPATHSSGLYIAYERGYFAELGIDADLTPMTSLPDAAVLMSTGQLDLYGGGTGAALYNAVSRGIRLHAVADKAHGEPGVKYKGFMARKDLWDSGEIRTIAALRGRPIVANPGGGGIEYQLEKVLQTAGMTVQDIDFKGMSVPDQLAALSNRGADGAFLFQPALCTAEKLNLAVVVPPMLDEVAPGLQGGVINYADQFTREKPEVARNLMVGYVRGIRDYNDAQLHQVNRPTIVEIMQKYVTLPDVSYYDDCEWGRVNPDGRIDRRWIEDEMLWSVKVGLLDKIMPVDQLVDDSYVDYALAKLGPYQPASR